MNKLTISAIRWGKEGNMIKLTNIFDLLGIETKVIICEGENKLYSGFCGNCPRNIWKNAYIKNMDFNKHLERYIISVRYM